MWQCSVLHLMLLQLVWIFLLTLTDEMPLHRPKCFSEYAFTSPAMSPAQKNDKTEDASKKPNPLMGSWPDSDLDPDRFKTTPAQGTFTCCFSTCRLLTMGHCRDHYSLCTAQWISICLQGDGAEIMSRHLVLWISHGLLLETSLCPTRPHFPTAQNMKNFPTAFPWQPNLFSKYDLASLILMPFVFLFLYVILLLCLLPGNQETKNSWDWLKPAAHAHTFFKKDL